MLGITESADPANPRAIELNVTRQEKAKGNRSGKGWKYRGEKDVRGSYTNDGKTEGEEVLSR